MTQFFTDCFSEKKKGLVLINISKKKKIISKLKGFEIMSLKDSHGNNTLNPSVNFLESVKSATIPVS